MTSESTHKRPQAAEFTLSNVFSIVLCQLAIALLLIIVIRRQPFLSIFNSSVSFTEQLLVGLLTGIGLAGLQTLLLRFSARWQNILRRAAQENPDNAPLSSFSILAISVMVGFVEEILYRAALQPLLGIGFASVLFALVHFIGSLNRNDLVSWLNFIRLGMFVLVGMILGLLYIYFGLSSAIAAHVIYDIIVMFVYRRFFQTAK